MTHNKHLHRIAAYNTDAAAHRRFSAGGRLGIHLDMKIHLKMNNPSEYELLFTM
jgi:hypothetical protein